jgi:hypothetical protein
MARRLKRDRDASRASGPLSRAVDSGIGRAVAVAFARQGAPLAIAYLDEDDHAQETKRLIEEADRRALLIPGDLQSADHCRAVVESTVRELGGLDILVNNAAHQATFSSIEEIPDEEWELTFRVNVHAMFYCTKAAVRYMKPDGSIINTPSINLDAPSPHLLAYATTKGAIQNVTAGLAQPLADRAIRANAVGPVRFERRSSESFRTFRFWQLTEWNSLGITRAQPSFRIIGTRLPWSAIASLIS